MSQPLTDYFIASSHNTYLMEDQVTGPTSVNAYVRALLRYVKCLLILYNIQYVISLMQCLCDIGRHTRTLFYVRNTIKTEFCTAVLAADDDS